MIKHISFDVWNTLISPNPLFAEKRDEFLSRVSGLPKERVRLSYKDLKTELDREAEQEGIGYFTDGIYQSLAIDIRLSSSDSSYLRGGLEALFFEHPPIVLESTKHIVTSLYERGYTLSIASNTNFMRGWVLDKAALSQIGIRWNFQLYSDMIARSKPHSKFWLKVLSEAKESLLIEDNSEILHVGDNKICDGGCMTKGIQYQYVANPGELHKVLERLDIVASSSS